MPVDANPTGGRRVVADVVAGVGVALVLIPQCMAYADLAGLPPHYGLYASALPPLLAAFFASSPFLQTGPTALTALLSFAALSSLAAPKSAEYIGLAALLALVVGVVRVLIGVLRAGSISYLMSYAVLRGFTVAAALLILCSQLPKVLGVTPGDAGVLANAWSALRQPAAWEPAALLLSGITLVLMLGGRRLHALFPGVLVAVIIGVPFGSLTGYEGAMIGELPQAIVPPLSLDLPWSRALELLIPGAIIALVGFAEVASVAQSFAEESRRPWDPNAEFVGQGVANLAAGVAGGFPVGGSFSRSAVNRLAGAQTRWSGAITGLTVLVFLPFASILATLPTAVLGAIVVGAVLKLLDPRVLLRLFSESIPQAIIGMTTFIFTLALAPHIEYAVVIGVGLALANHAWREQRIEVNVDIDGGALTLTPEGVIWFGSAPMFRRSFAAEIAKHEDVDEVVIDLSHVGRIDHTGALALRDLQRTTTSAELRFESIPPHARRILASVCGVVDPHE